MTKGLRVQNFAAVGERPADIIRGRTGILVAGVGTVMGVPYAAGPTASGDFWVYDPATGTMKIVNTATVFSGVYLTTNYGEQHGLVTVAASGATYTLDCSLANIFDITLTANCTLSITNPPLAGVGGVIQIILRQGGSGSYTVTWPAAVTWQKADGTSGGSAPTLFTAVGAQDDFELSTLDGGTTWGGTHSGGTPGTVTSVALTVPAEFSVTGSPVTGSGTLAVTKANESANTVWAGPTSGAAAAPTFRALVAADIPAGTVGADHEHVMDNLYSGDGSTTVWTLPASPVNQYSVAAYVGGTLTEVTLSGADWAIATFGSAPASGTNNIRFDIVAALT